MGAFETEVTIWLQNIKQWIYSHERFTWINLILAIIPSPISGLLAIILALLQLYLCLKGRIPKTEKNILLASLILGIISLVASSILIIYLVKQGWSIWHTFNPFFWLIPLKQKFFNGGIINVINKI